jgi:hypothetical protein
MPPSKQEPRNLALTKTCQVLVDGPTHVSMPTQPKPLKHIPPKNVMFRPHPHVFHVPPCDPPPMPHDALKLFQLSHTLSNFLQTILSRQLMKVME